MRFKTMLFSSFLLLMLLVLPVSADNYASKVDAVCTVDNVGTCSVYLDVTLHMEVPDKSLTFPLPGNATNIKLNDATATTVRNGSNLGVMLDKVTGGLSGDFRLAFTYDLPKAVRPSGNDQLTLTVPLLSGFSYPIQSFTFTVNMQGDVTNRPDFYSTYRQDAILSSLFYQVSGGMLIGAVNGSMNDHEALTMTMIVDPAIFPTISVYQRVGNPEVAPMAGFGIAALIFWILFLRTWFFIPQDANNPPDGLTAGELGCRLTLDGGDLTMMVFSWAQLGYLLMQLDPKGRVILHKQMDMGNERGLFEIRVFQSLFSRSDTVDTTLNFYAKQRKKTAGMVPGQNHSRLSSPAAIKLFRFIAMGSMVFLAICLAMNFTTVGALQALIAVGLGIAAMPSAWLLQEAAFCTFRRSKTPLWIALGVAVLWIALGFFATVPVIALCVVLGELAIGFLAAFGGKRSELNRAEAGQILGLRSYLRHIPADELQWHLSTDPDYFFRMLPYAMALGVEKPFCKQFGDRKIRQCPYIAMNTPGKRTAEEWSWVYGLIIDRMDKRYRKMLRDKWLIIRLR